MKHSDGWVPIFVVCKCLEEEEEEEKKKKKLANRQVVVAE